MNLGILKASVHFFFSKCFTTIHHWNFITTKLQTHFFWKSPTQQKRQIDVLVEYMNMAAYHRNINAFLSIAIEHPSFLQVDLKISTTEKGSNWKREFYFFWKRKFTSYFFDCEGNSFKLFYSLISIISSSYLYSVLCSLFLGTSFHFHSAS